MNQSNNLIEPNVREYVFVLMTYILCYKYVKQKLYKFKNKIMKTELTLLERREIARKTIPTKKVKKDKLQGWGLLLAMTHKHETYDFFKIPKYKDEVEEYYRNNPIVFDPDKGVSVKN